MIAKIGLRAMVICTEGGGAGCMISPMVNTYGTMTRTNDNDASVNQIQIQCNSFLSLRRASGSDMHALRIGRHGSLSLRESTFVP